MRKQLSEEIQRAIDTPSGVSAQDLARWTAWAVSLESRIATARGILEEFDADDTYGTMVKLSAIEALDGEE